MFSEGRSQINVVVLQLIVNLFSINKKFGVEVSLIRKWVDSNNKTIENTKGEADKTDNKENEEDPDSQEDEDDDPDFGSVPGENPRMKRVKELPDDIKEATVKYGLEHGWTAAARPPSQDGPRMMIQNLRGNLRLVKEAYVYCL